MVESRRYSYRKNLLQLDIVDRQQKDGTYFFCIKICKNYDSKDV